VQKQISLILRDREAYIWAVADYALKDYAGDGEDRKKLLGGIYEEVQMKVNAVVRAARMICGPINPYGNGEERREKLEKEGLPYSIVQGYIDRKREELL
jgi:precorrin-4 methylase